MKCISLKSVMGGVFKMTLLALTVASLGTACNKSQSSPAGAPAEPTDEVVFSAGGPAMNSAVSTKATVVDALPSFYAGCTTGAAGSEVSVWNSTTFTGSGSPMVYKGDKWWPITDPSYHFYASNAALSFAAGGTTVAASNATDVICAYLPEPTYKVRNVLSFEHIFARLGQVTVSASASYAISNVSISITPKVSGTYNLRTGAGKTDGTGWSGTADGSAAVIAARAAELARSGNFSQANDIYLVPGTYTISATWTATAPGYSETFSNKTQEISITAGKVNKITTTLGGRGTEIEFGVEIAAWDETTQDVDFLDSPLTFTIVSGGKIIWKCTEECTPRTIRYSKNGGEWVNVTSTVEGVEIPVATGDVLEFKGDNDCISKNEDEFCRFSNSNGTTFHASGSVMSLLSGGGKAVLPPACFYMLFAGSGILSAPTLPATTLASGCYKEMFEGCSSLTSAPELPATTLAPECYAYMFLLCSSLTVAPELPATTLANNCYEGMFSQCSNLSIAPELPATTLTKSCYEGMFNSCRSLTSAPELPATTLAISSYDSMFNGCTSLVAAPELPATTLASGCYNSMFWGCKNMIVAPSVLPATTLANSCYQSMFQGCSSLTTAPELPATTLKTSCYDMMFYNCSQLNNVTCYATDISASNCLYGWLQGTSSTGTFTKHPDMNSWPRSASGIPSGWTVVNAI